MTRKEVGEVSTSAGLPLVGVRVVELSGGRGEMCARLLADLGADVVLVEPPGGAVSRLRGPWSAGQSLYFASRNAGKRSVVADLSTTSGRDLVLKLAMEADILIDSLGAGALIAAGIDPAALRKKCSQLVIASLSEFGQTGPYRHYRGSEAVLTALGGVLSRSGLPGRPPVVPPGELASESAAIQATWCVLLAYWNRLHQAGGDQLDISLHETTAQVFDPALGVTGTAAAGKSALTLPHGRPDEGHRYPIFPCSDGHVRMCLLAPRQWHAMRDWLGNPDELMDPRLDSTAERLEAWDELRPFLGQLFADVPAGELVTEAQRRGIPLERLSSPGEVLADEHFAARGAFTDLEIGGGIGAMPSGFVDLDGERAGVRGPAPACGNISEVGNDWPARDFAAPTAAQSVTGLRRPLSGLRVLDLGVIVAGAELGRLFAAQGAEVIKIENTQFPDGSRHSAWGSAMSPSFASGHRGKRSIGVNLRSESGRAVLLDLVANADLVFSNFKPGTMDKLGLGAEVLASVNPRIISVESSALGSTGPRSRSMGYGPLVRAATSLTMQWRDSDIDDGFCDSVTIFPDHFVARVCSVGALALLIRRMRTNIGGTVSVSQAETIINSIPEFFLAESLNSEPVNQVDILLACAGDDQWCAVTVFDEVDWARVVEYLGLNGDSDQHLVLDQLRTWAAALPPMEVMDRLQQIGVAAGAMIRPSEYHNDPQLTARQFTAKLNQPGLAEQLLVENAPCHSVQMPDPELVPAPFMFAHTRQVAREVLGLNDARIDELIAAGALETNPTLDAVDELTINVAV